MSDKEDRIRQRAYEKWQKDGESHGGHDRHWAEAEAELSSEADASLSSEAAATPMMDEAGTPNYDQIKSDAGASAASAAVAGLDTKPARGPAATSTAPVAAKKPAARKSGKKA